MEALVADPELAGGPIVGRVVCLPSSLFSVFSFPQASNFLPCFFLTVYLLLTITEVCLRLSV